MKLFLERLAVPTALCAAFALLLGCGQEISVSATQAGSTSGSTSVAAGEPASAETTTVNVEVAAASALASDRSTRPKSLKGLDLSKVKGAKKPVDAAPVAGVVPTKGAKGVIPATDPKLTKNSPAGAKVRIPTAANRKAKVTGFEGAALTKDFGDLLAGDRGTHIFRLVSSGADPLVFAKIKPSCGCTLARTTVVAADGTTKPYIIGDEIPVGTRFEIETQLKTDGRNGALATQVQLTGNTIEPVTNLKLKAKIQPILEVKPSPNLNFGPMVTNERKEGSLTISSKVLEPFRLIIDEKFVVDPLEVSVVPVDPNAEGKSTTWTVNIALGPKVIKGFRNYPLRFTTDTVIPDGKTKKNYEPRVYVQANVTGLVAAKPGFVSFGVVRPGQTVTRKVMLECMDDFPLTEDMVVTLEPLQKNLSVPYLDRFTTSITIVDPAKSRAELSVTLTGMPDDFNSSFGGMIRVKVGHPEEDMVDVRFSGVCRPGIPSAGSRPAGSRPSGKLPPQPVKRTGGR